MTHGMAGTIILYDKDGNPVEVAYSSGAYKLQVQDEEAGWDKQETIELLKEIRDILVKIQEDM